MKKAQVRLDDLPQGMTNDSEAQRVGDEVVVAASLKGKGWYVRASERCGVCHGHGMMIRIEHDVYEEPDPVNPGKKITRRESTEVEGACDCVVVAANMEERRASLLGKPAGPPPSTPPPADPPPPPNLRLEQRAARLRQEITAVEADIAATALAHEKRVAPFLARVVEVEREAENAVVHDHGCRLAVQESKKLADEAQDTLHQVQEALKAALAAHAEAQVLAEKAQQQLAPLALAIAKAKEEARKAQTTGGARHKIDVQRKRIDDLRRRLEAITRDLGRIVREPEQAEGTP